MRLFIALLLDEPVKDALCGAIDNLKAQSVQGNFTRRENLHLTLVFIGETTRLGAVKQAMDMAEAQPFPLKFRGLGRFRRDGGDIWWAGVEPEETLSSLYSQLFGSLSRAGFLIEKREFKPHLTLGRQVLLRGQPQPFVPAVMRAGRISLMKSERIGGRLIYTEVYARNLAPRD